MLTLPSSSQHQELFSKLAFAAGAYRHYDMGGLDLTLARCCIQAITLLAHPTLSPSHPLIMYPSHHLALSPCPPTLPGLHKVIISIIRDNRNSKIW